MRKINTFITALAIFIIFSSLNVYSDVIPVVSKDTMAFGSHTFCERPRDTVRVLNAAISSENLILLTGEVILGTDNTCFTIINPKPNNIDLPPYDGTSATIYVVEFDPTVGSPGPKFARLQIPTQVPGTPIIIEITATSEKIDYNVNPNPVDFGDRSLNISYPGSSTITLNASQDVHIADIKNSKSELVLDLIGFDYNLTPTDNVRNIKFNLKLTAIGPFNDIISVHFDLPCDTTIKIPISANGTASSISAQNNIDFGTVSKCNKKDINVDFSFSGAGSGQILNIGAITGNLSNLFTAKFLDALPINMDGAKNTATLVITYQGNDVDLGIANITVPVSTIVDGVSVPINIKCTANVQPIDLISDKMQLNYGVVGSGTVNPLDVNISNNQNFDVKITSYSITGNYPGYFSFNPAFAPITLSNSQSKIFTVNYNPILPDVQVNCVLTFYFEGADCTDSLKIDLIGETFRGDNLIFSFNNQAQFEFDPKAANGTLPITLHAEFDDVYVADTFNLQLEFPRAVYYPTKVMVNNASIPFNLILNGDNYLMDFSALFNGTVSKTAETQFIELQGTPLLGDQLISKFEIKKVSMKSLGNLFSTDSTLSTMVKLLICQSGDDRLLQVQNGIPGMTIMQMNSSSISVKCNLLEKGSNKIYLTDILGNIILVNQFFSENNSVFDTKFDLNQVSAGTYFIVLETVNDKFSLKFRK